MYVIFLFCAEACPHGGVIVLDSYRKSDKAAELQLATAVSSAKTEQKGRHAERAAERK
ncbi:hypothetical protein [Acinetobacter pragensis]|uniref:hypothetical protein n=1 Tax=Acinetobacter pragensis TaxID=1806892 RepID=UPI00333F070B